MVDQMINKEVCQILMMNTSLLSECKQRICPQWIISTLVGLIPSKDVNVTTDSTSCELNLTISDIGTSKVLKLIHFTVILMVTTFELAFIHMQRSQWKTASSSASIECGRASQQNYPTHATPARETECNYEEISVYWWPLRGL